MTLPGRSPADKFGRTPPDSRGDMRFWQQPVALGYQGPGRNWMSPYQARVVVPVLSVSVSSP
jgi:hypothetical protein